MSLGSSESSGVKSLKLGRFFLVPVVEDAAAVLSLSEPSSLSMETNAAGEGTGVLGPAEEGLLGLSGFCSTSPRCDEVSFSSLSGFSVAVDVEDEDAGDEGVGVLGPAEEGLLGLSGFSGSGPVGFCIFQTSF
ncbi:hypothetical protein NRI_0792 [Neorickettsia risticii str. Illinois]|uniref:Uncharacterized protein n=1 Tax=Neorickettsia risticii (strain Illinois) TaxID=434131 RepID=C6V5U5_NEORI|nr:hypothetical protein NRI_0792 [Neorickettsia risticii str. Illinois]